MGLPHSHKLSVPKAAVWPAGGEVVTATLPQAICPKGCSEAGRRGGGTATLPQAICPKGCTVQSVIPNTTHIWLSNTPMIAAKLTLILIILQYQMV